MPSPETPLAHELAQEVLGLVERLRPDVNLPRKVIAFANGQAWTASKRLEHATLRRPPPPLLMAE
jgi:hypothetical protein